jgi:predicted Zn-dependent protease
MEITGGGSSVSHEIGMLSSTDSGMADFKECLKHIRGRQPLEALLHVRRALEVAPKNPFYLSYAGLLTASAERRFRDAEDLCLEALAIRHNHPQLYLNLAQVYQNAGRTQEGIEVLEKALVSTGRDCRIQRARQKIGARREPVFSFLQRNHPLNQMFGKWRHRLMGPSMDA